jgi:hypothetical protein
MGRITKRSPVLPSSIEDFSNAEEQVQNIDIFNNASFNDLGPRNSALMINRFEEDNGFLGIFTDLDTHIEVGDKVYITENGGNSALDNFEAYKLSDDFPFTEFSQGYNVIKV